MRTNYHFGILNRTLVHFFNKYDGANTGYVGSLFPERCESLIPVLNEPPGTGPVPWMV